MFGFIKKKKDKKPEQQTVKTNNTGKGQQETKDVSEDYMQQLKKVAMKYIPDKFDADSIELIFDMINDVIEAELVQIMMRSTTWAKAKIDYERAGTDAERYLKDAFAETGYKINQYMNAIKEEIFLEKIRQSNDEALLKAFIAADFYSYNLKPEYSNQLNKLKHSIAREFLNRGNVFDIQEYTSELEKLKNRCYDAIKENSDSELSKKLKEELGKKILELDNIYIIYDEDFNNNFPYIGIDGRIEICTQQNIADAVLDYYSKQHLGHVSIRKISRENIKDYFVKFLNMGILVFRLDNGTKPIDIWFKDFLNTEHKNLLEEENQGMRACFLRELQYGYRISKIDQAEKDEKFEHSLQEMMLTMRYNAYRDLGNGLVYVLATTPYIEGVTFYTPKALEKAQSIISEKQLSENALIASGDKEYREYKEKVNLRVAQKPGQGMEDSLVCVFTGRYEAEQVRINFNQYGINDNVLVITFEELYSHAMQCNGILIDMPTYGLELLKKDFDELLKWRAVKGRILVNLKNNK